MPLILQNIVLEMVLSHLSSIFHALCVFQDSIIIKGALKAGTQPIVPAWENYRHLESGQMSGVFKREMITPPLLRRGSVWPR